MQGCHDGIDLDDPASIDLLDEVGDVGVGWTQNDVLAGALLDDFTIAQDRNLVAQPKGFVEVMGDEDDGF